MKILIIIIMTFSFSAFAGEPKVQKPNEFLTNKKSDLSRVLVNSLLKHSNKFPKEAVMENQFISVLAEDGKPYVKCDVIEKTCKLSADLNQWGSVGQHGSDRVDQIIFHALYNYASEDIDLYVGGDKSRTFVKLLPYQPVYKVRDGSISCSAVPVIGAPNAFKHASCHYDVLYLYGENLAKEVYEYAKNHSDHIGDRLKSLENSTEFEVKEVHLISNLKHQYGPFSLRVNFRTTKKVDEQNHGDIGNIIIESLFQFGPGKLISENTKEYVNRIYIMRRTGSHGFRD